MVVCHSGSRDLKADVYKILEILNDRFSYIDLCTAMAAYWIDLYFYWKNKSPIAEEKIRVRLQQIFDFIMLDNPC
jgi:hypothetical protein